MISHEYKCIFIHIPRTAGSLIEKKILGTDMEYFAPELKHLNASEAKEIYSKWWNEYFKFSIVRNPFDWLASYCNWSHFKAMYNDDFNNALSAFLSSSLISDYTKIYNDTQYSLQSEILNEQIDYVGKFESLKQTFSEISDGVGIKLKPSFFKYRKTQGRKYSDYRKYFSQEQIDLILKKWGPDFERFNYSY